MGELGFELGIVKSTGGGGRTCLLRMRKSEPEKLGSCVGVASIAMTAAGVQGSREKSLLWKVDQE